MDTSNRSKLNSKIQSKDHLPSLSSYKQSKTRVNELALLGASLDEEEITDKILDSLNDDYKEVVHVV
jgi:hypothetical protein